MSVILSVLLAYAAAEGTSIDSTVQVGVLGIITTVVTTAGVVVVAIVNNKRERGQAAESAIVTTLRERITLRDEQIEELREDVTERDLALAERDQMIRELWARVEGREATDE